MFVLDRAIEITGVSIARPNATKVACRIIAYVDVDAAGFEPRGCALIRTSSGGRVSRGSLMGHRVAPSSCRPFGRTLARRRGNWIT